MAKVDNQAPIGDEVAEVPKRVLATYSRLWQLETWLRRMVYVELRALLGDGWSDGLPTSSASMAADKRLTHMPTPEMNALSYAQLSKLQDLITGTGIALLNISLRQIFGRPSSQRFHKLDIASRISVSGMSMICSGCSNCCVTSTMDFGDSVLATTMLNP